MINKWTVSRQRRGIALVVVMTAMIVVVGILVPLIPPALRARRQVEIEEVALQTEFLKNAVTRRLLMSQVSDAADTTDLGRLAGQVRLGRGESLSGEWFVRSSQDKQEIDKKTEIIIRLKFLESSELGSSPLLVPGYELSLLLPLDTNNRP
ncbi:hypothetical protein SH449x_001932 [Pirellulaceae bacterium SH449]